MDAHDALGVAGAQVVVVLSHGELRTAISDADGRFEIPTDGTPHAAGRIRVEAVLHASLERPLPPPGRLAITLVTRKRALLARLVLWGGRRGSALQSAKEPTPAEVARAASRAARTDIATWASAVEAAAFGAEAVGAAREAQILALEPSDQQEQGPAFEPESGARPSDEQ
jgi:hypothetical protein